MKVSEELLNDVKNQWNALGQKVYEIAMINYETGKKLEDIQGWQLFESHGLERALYMNTHRQENIYIRALLDDRHDVIILDDIRMDGLQYLRQHYPIACVVETSIDAEGPNYQCWLRLSGRFHKPERMRVERALLHELKSKGFYADLGAADGCHLGRLAGFRNLGFAGKKDRDHIVRLIESEGKTLSVSTTDDLLERGKQLPVPVKVSKEGFAYDMEEIRCHEYERVGIMQYFKEKILPTVHQDETDKSKVDFYLARQLIRNGYSEKDTRKVLVEHGPNDVSRKDDPAYYICQTVASAIVRNSDSRQGGGCGSALRRESSSDAPSSTYQQAPAPAEPEEKTAYAGNGTGKKMRGMIDLNTGQITFGVAEATPAPKPQIRKNMRPRIGVRPAARRAVSPGPKP